MRVRNVVPFLGRAAWLVALGLTLPAGAVPPEPQDSRPAARVWVVEDAMDKVEIVAAGTAPPTFILALVREMPTPGWTWRADEIAVDAANGRITARVTELAPQGMTAQVITATRFELPLGQIEAGSYFLELWIRRDPGRQYRPAHALVIEAR